MKTILDLVEEKDAELKELRGFKELATKQLREMTEEMKALQSKCVAYEGELEKKDEEISKLKEWSCTSRR